LTITRGGRFYHMLAAGQNKGRAVVEAIELFQDGHPDRPAAVGLGDAANDYSMLKAVDIPVLIPKPDGSYEKMELPGLSRAPYPGSKGWGIVVAGILDEFERRTP